MELERPFIQIQKGFSWSEVRKSEGRKSEEMTGKAEASEDRVRYCFVVPRTWVVESSFEQLQQYFQILELLRKKGSAFSVTFCNKGDWIGYTRLRGYIDRLNMTKVAQFIEVMWEGLREEPGRHFMEDPQEDPQDGRQTTEGVFFHWVDEVEYIRYLSKSLGKGTPI